eukprot:jgi/Astpho2/1918/Aster-00436
MHFALALLVTTMSFCMCCIEVVPQHGPMSAIDQGENALISMHETVQDLQKELSRIATNLGKPVREPVGRLAGNRLLTSPVQKAAAASEEEARVTPVSPRTAEISARLEAAAALPGRRETHRLVSQAAAAAHRAPLPRPGRISAAQSRTSPTQPRPASPGTAQAAGRAASPHSCLYAPEPNTAADYSQQLYPEGDLDLQRLRAKVNAQIHDQRTRLGSPAPRDPNEIESAARDPRPTIAASKRRQLADQAARQQAEQERAARKQQQPQWELDQAAAAVYQKQSFDLSECRCMAATLLQERKEPVTPASVGYDRHWTHTPDLPAAASTALVQQEGKRLSRHATADGASLQLQGILRNPRQMPAVLNACSRLAQLTDVNLACNALDEPAAAQLLGLLDQAPHISSLNLGQNQLGPPTAQHLAAVLRWRPKVSKFRQTATTVLAALPEAPRESRGEGLRQVVAAAVHAQGGAISSAALAERPHSPGHPRRPVAPPRGAQLRRLVLDHNPLGDQGLQVLVEAIGSAAALRELHLGRCALSPRSAPAIEDLLRTAPALESLQLCWNHLGTKGGEAIAAGLQVNQRLKWLDASHAGLSDAGGAHVAFSLMENRTLVNLDLASNGLQQDTCAVLQHVLPSGALQTLSVAANPLGRQAGFVDPPVKPPPPPDPAAASSPVESTAKGGSKRSTAAAKPAGKTSAGKTAAGKPKAAAAAQAAPAKPAGPVAVHYSLDLARPAHRVLALQLVQQLHAGQITWKGLVLGGRAWKGALPPDGWPAAMPAQGALEVDCKPVGAAAGPTLAAVQAAGAVQPKLVSSLCQQLSDPGQLEHWRMELMHMVQAAQLPLNADQVVQLLQAFPPHASELMGGNEPGNTCAGMQQAGSSWRLKPDHHYQLMPVVQAVVLNACLKESAHLQTMASKTAS